MANCPLCGVLKPVPGTPLLVEKCLAWLPLPSATSRTAEWVALFPVERGYGDDRPALEWSLPHNLALVSGGIFTLRLNGAGWGQL